MNREFAKMSRKNRRPLSYAKGLLTVYGSASKNAIRVSLRSAQHLITQEVL